MAWPEFILLLGVSLPAFDVRVIGYFNATSERPGAVRTGGYFKKEHISDTFLSVSDNPELRVLGKDLFQVRDAR
jgi:hypothetical protein